MATASNFLARVCTREYYRCSLQHAQFSNDSCKERKLSNKAGLDHAPDLSQIAKKGGPGGVVHGFRLHAPRERDQRGGAANRRDWLTSV